MLPSTGTWSSHYGSNFPASSSLTNFGERSHHNRMASMMMMSNQSPSHWGNGGGGGGGGHVVHRPHNETGFVPPPVDLRYQQGAADGGWMSSTSPRGSAGGFAVKDELSDASEYSSSEDACSDYRDALGGGGGGGGGGAAGLDHRGGDLGDRSRRTTTDRRADNESMTAEEAEKRRVRRERNKMAAARCRQRRVDLTNQLLAETETLEDERDSLQKEIQALQRQRSQLEDLLGSHAPQCKSRALINNSNSGGGGGGGGGHVIDIPPIKTEKCDDYFNITETGLRRASCNSYSLPTTAFQSCSRPDSLPLTTRRSKLLIAAHNQPMTAGGAAAVSNLGLDCMLDGHTGLTPITGAPSAPEGIVRSPPVDCGGYSPTTLMTL